MKVFEKLEKLRGMSACAIRISFALLFAVVVAEACQVPVFRYALERWSPDPYQLVIVHDGNLTGGQKSNLVHLEESLVGSNGPIVNLRFETIDLTKEKDQLERWQKIHMEGNASVTMHLFYPFQGFEPGALPIWNGAFTKKNIGSILNSPFRRELVKSILSGNSAVWLFLESGNKEEDDKLFKELEKHARVAEKEIAIPEGVIQQSALDDPDLLLGPGAQENILDSSVPLKIAFSILRLSRKDPEEFVLRAMLMNLEEDLLDEEFADKPMLFSVFGKGRVLPPLIGPGINEENALGDCGYLCGPCSCQVKNQNPGMDLLVKTDWWTALEGSSVIVEKELPPLTGVDELIAANEPAADLADEKNSSDGNASDPAPSVDLANTKNLPEANASDSPLVGQSSGTDSTPFPKGIVIAVVLFSGILLIGTFVLNKNRER
jgi:hypothetical protein